MSNVRPPAVAGLFYPGQAAALSRSLSAYVAAEDDDGPAPKALILPHAGYVYSGPVAGVGYHTLQRLRGRVTRVVLLGPAHRVPVRGIALSTAASFSTPLGTIPVDRETVARLKTLPGVVSNDVAHAPEHSLEVHLPFLQHVLASFDLVPLLAGDASDETTAAVLDLVWGGPETVVVVSSDLSHYLDYEAARALDEETASSIEHLDGKKLHGHRACGYVGIRGLLVVARRRGLRVRRLDLRNSGDTAGPRDHVVGYGAWALA